jgi:predicted lipoprotein with Yx(FWY)xxD motif
MALFSKLVPVGRSKSAVALVVAMAGFATAALGGVALAKAFTLQAAKNAKVVDQMGVSKHENIVVTSRGSAVYRLTGDSKQHPKCTKADGCFKFWPSVTVASSKKLTEAPGIAGKLGVWHRNGFFQLTLGGHPLYRFALDSQKRVAIGEGIKSFAGTWHVLKSPGATGGSTTTSTGTTATTTTTGTTSTMTSTTTPCLYPPYC